MKYFVYNNNGTLGPLTEEEIRAQLKSGELLSSCQVCKEGEETWTPVDEDFDNLEYKLPPPPQSSPKRKETAPKTESENEPPLQDSIEDKLPRPLRSIYEAGITPALKFAAPIAAVGGFVSDVLQPIGPFSLYLFLLSILVALGAGTLIWIQRRKAKRGCGPTCSRICCFATVSAVVLGITWIFFTSTNPDTGFLASKISAVEEIQKSLLGVQESMERVETTIVQVSTDVTEIKTDVKDISKGVTNIGKMGGIISDPDTAVELYNNALIFTERGDAVSQRRVLEEFVKTGEQKIEPYEMLAQVLKGMEGPQGAREAYEQLIKENPKNAMLRVYLFRLLENEEIVPHLRKIIDANPEFTPAFYEILGRGMYTGLLIQDNGDAIMRASLRFGSESYERVPFWTHSPEEKKMYEDEEFLAKALDEELRKRGIDPEKMFNDEYRRTFPDLSIHRRNAKQLAKQRDEIRRCESELAFYRDVRKPASQKFIAEIESQIEAALGKDKFAKIYESYLKVIEERPLREFVYDTKNAYYADYPQTYYSQGVTRYITNFERDKEEANKQIDEQIQKAQEKLDHLKSELEAINEELK